MIVALPADHDVQGMLALREDILSSPVSVALERARTYTRVFRENEGAPWMVAKALAFREHLRTIPLYLRPHDRIAGSISAPPGKTPTPTATSSSASPASASSSSASTPTSRPTSSPEPSTPERRSAGQAMLPLSRLDLLQLEQPDEPLDERSPGR